MAGLIPKGDNPGELHIENVVSRSEQRTMSQGSAYALVAADEALKDANWQPTTDEDKQRTGYYANQIYINKNRDKTY